MEDEWIEKEDDLSFDSPEQIEIEDNVYDVVTTLVDNVSSDDTNHKEVSFGGHASGKCNLCSCSHFRPSSDEKYCVCGHSDYDHEWV